MRKHVLNSILLFKSKANLETALNCSLDHIDIKHCVIPITRIRDQPAEIYCKGNIWKWSHDIKVRQIWITETCMSCVRGNVCVFNFRLYVRNRFPPDLPNGACHVGSGSVSVSADIHSCHDKNLQETQEEVSMSVYHLITNKKQYNTLFWHLLTCVTTNF